jgi:ferredoxin-NADP reductase
MSVFQCPTQPLAPGEDLLLLYRASSAADVLFRDELDDLAARRGARVVYLAGHDRELLSAAGLRRLVSDLPARDVYPCGPPALTAVVRRSLRDAGLPVEQLHEERFAF